MKVFKTEIQVRAYELDSYGHVNHAIYLHYAEHARWCAIEEAVGDQRYFAEKKLGPVIVRIEIDYRKPSFRTDILVVESSLLDHSRHSFRIKQTIKKRDSQSIVAEVIAVNAVVDAQGKAAEIPADFLARFSVSKD